MSVDFSSGDNPNLNSAINHILADLEDKQRTGDRTTVGAFFDERLSHLVESHLLNPQAKQNIATELSRFQKREVRSLNTQDFSSLKDIFQQSLSDSGVYEEPISLVKMLQEAITRLETPHSNYGLKECILELQDPILKSELVKFCVENKIDPTVLISHLSPNEKTKLLKFFHKQLAACEKKESQALQKSAALLTRAGIDVKEKKAIFKDKSKEVATVLSRERHALCVSGMSNFRPDLLTVADSEEQLQTALEIKERCGDFPVCSLVRGDLLTSTPRTSYLNVKFPGSAGAYLDTGSKVSQLFQKIEFFAESLGCSEVQKERLMLVLSFFCTQHVPNGFLIMFRHPLLQKLLEIGVENYTTKLTSAHLEFNPVIQEDGSLKPLAFLINFSAVLDVCPDITFEYTSFGEKEMIEKALMKEGLGSCFTFKFFGSLEVDGSLENPGVVVRDYNIR